MVVRPPDLPGQSLPGLRDLLLPPLPCTIAQMQEQRSHIRNTRGATANTPADPVVAANPQIASGNQSVARALSMLALLATVPDGMGVRDIAKRLRLAPSIVQRGINTLAASGFVERSHVPQRYRIGYTAFQVGNAFLNGSDLAEIATSEL